ncbi:MAG: MipA/OmpV family protein, partial [Zoogloea sp.]|nr:MipA/OmpV family protein [Zoogloea sp.]
MSYRNAGPAVAALAATALAGGGAHADEPLWEIGLGAGVVSFPDYRGADRQRTVPLPVPYFIYRGEIFKADRNGLRGTFLDTGRMSLNLSLSASLPVDSSGNTARQGMPDLKPTVELGPSLEFNLWRSDDARRKLDLRLPLRKALTIEASPHNAGWVFSPRLNLDLIDPAGHGGWRLGLLAGPLFGDRRQNAYFYDVAPQYATAARPAYQAGAGYAGSQFLGALSRRYRDFWVGGFLRYDTLAGAAFEDSPLVRTRSVWAGGLAISWILDTSSRQVSTEE